MTSGAVHRPHTLGVILVAEMCAQLRSSVSSTMTFHRPRAAPLSIRAHGVCNSAHGTFHELLKFAKKGVIPF